MNTRNLLVELLVEELPPKALARLGQAFADTLAQSLQAQGLAPADATVTPYATPRRLAVHVTQVLARAPDRLLRHKLMPVRVGLDEAGQPTPALLKRLAALGAAPDAVAQLQRASDGKTETLYFDAPVAGATLAAGLQKALDDALAALPIPKLMSYQLDRGVDPAFQPGWTTVHFVRPAHRLVALYGSEVIDVSTLGLMAGRNTLGHRFEAATRPITLRDADAYVAQLRDEGAVIASFAERRAEIVRQLQAAARAEGLQPIDDDALLDEVTALVERPNVLPCRFEPAFLAVPPECLILTMKANQKYFPLLDADGGLTDRFLVVSNIRPADASAVVHGNERVVRPRLADARFFYEQDCKKTLASRVDALAHVVYLNKLGDAGDLRTRCERVRLLAGRICALLGADGPSLEAVQQAALLTKADLTTEMVGEFPELQGIMGRYYARHDGLADEVAYAIEEHYRPRFAGDALPRSLTGVIVALADKLETLVALFGVGELPSGDKDPYALRRHALGLIRLLAEKELPLELDALFDAADVAFNERATWQPSLELRSAHAQERAPAEQRAKPAPTLVSSFPVKRAELAAFIYDRLAAALRDQGYSAQEIDAVLSLRPQRLAEVPRCLAAVREFAALPAAGALSAANKRVGNILKKADAAIPRTFDVALLHEAAEVTLGQALNVVRPQADAAFERGDYTASLQSLAALKAPVDAFFDAVLVNADDPALRNNRLALLAALHGAMNRVADLSKLAS